MMLGLDQSLFYVQGESATGDTTATPLDLRDEESALVVLNVTAITGTSPTLTVDLLTLDPNTKGWVRVGGFTQVTATGVTTVALTPGNVPNKLAAKYTIGGTSPSVTASCFVCGKRK